MNTIKKIIIFILIICQTLILSSCSKSTDVPQNLQITDSTTSSQVLKQDNKEEKKTISHMDKDIVHIEPSLYKNSYYGVPVKLNGTYYKIPAMKLLNYYFIDINSLNKIYNTTINVNNLKKITSKIDISKIDKGTINAENLDVKDTSIDSNSSQIIVKYKNKTFINIKSISDYLSDKLYVDPESETITNKKIEFSELPETNNGLLRKRVIIDKTHDLTVKETSHGHILTIGDIYGTSLEIIPNNDTNYSSNYQNMFIKKNKDGKYYLFGLLNTSVEIFELNISKNLTVKFKEIGFIQKPVSNIYYLNNRYLAVGQKNIYEIVFSNNGVCDISLKNTPTIIESNTTLNFIKNIPYLTIKNTDGHNQVIKIEKLNINDFSFKNEYTFNNGNTYKTVNKNFMYSHVISDKINIFIMADDKYIYNMIYDPITKTSSKTKTNNFKLYYQDTPYNIDLTLHLANTNSTEKSKLKLDIDSHYIGDEYIVYAAEDNWVYCLEYSNYLSTKNLIGFRYNIKTGIRDYSYNTYNVNSIKK